MKFEDYLKEHEAWKKTPQGRIHTAFWFIVRPFVTLGDWLQDTPQRIKFFIQRGRRGYSDRDTWELGYYWLSMMADSLKQYKKETMGHPANYHSMKEYRKELDKIIDGLEAGKDMCYEILDPKVYAKKQRKLQYALMRLSNDIAGLWY